MNLEQTIKDLEQLEQSLKGNVGDITEEQLEKLTSHLQEVFNLAQGEIDKMENESKIQLEKIQNEK
jgi:hypothetical protein